MCRNLLQPEAKRRSYPYDALRHQWFSKKISGHDQVTVPFVINRDAVEAVLSIEKKDIVHRALLNLVYSNLASVVEDQEVRDIFKTMDINFDGMLDMKELQIGLKTKGVKDF